ncbi:zinc-dependent alcohol dehydrogenase family protein [Pinisolibacter aquiterrae]|uniref:zinc-dependent alcohol dehydrogenase family protein n=1 Tax=Pinisolibacter aquiterrae TaxID=2815579 RepID=UPI001C3E31E6|nr:NAD(P)-dependent alcohol dehydrogenase [Pinisolibacter aquiterrae]MBV5266538.1 NAD(P)-dependent alcohol dehydrogenase [Pinisolibacter aquiterrae]MCC8234689.1 NAD(P)-dependent alcohol dehydrogenase [Pinisolibacter aquiterrae]
MVRATRLEITAFGLDGLRLATREVGEPGPGEVRLRLQAASLNRRDLLLVEGIYNPKQTLPVVPCSDGAGIVEAVGPGVTRVAPGDRVALHFFTGWISGEPNTEKLATALGGPGGDGTLATHMIVSAEAVVKLPEAIDTATAATLPCAALTAWSAIVDLGRVRPGDTVLIQGTGGVSLFALQFAVRAGARVIGLTSSPERAEVMRRLGAAEVVNYREVPKWGPVARDLAGGRLDLVVEVGGAETLDQSVRFVRPGGTVALIGVLSGNFATFNLSLAVMRQVRMQGVTCGDREAFEAMLRSIAVSGIDPVIDSRFVLTDARAAFERMKANGHVGKILIDLEEAS